MDAIRKQARTAGALYLLACLPGPFYLLYVPGRVFVPGDVATTADRVHGLEGLLRMGIAGELLSATLLIFAVLALYRLFKSVSERQAQLMAILLLVSVPISYLNAINVVAALALARGTPFLGALQKPQLDALSYLFLRLHSQGFVVAQIFWGLWLLPYGRLVMRSTFIPHVLGVFLIIAGVGYIVSSVAVLFVPTYAHAVTQVTMILEAGEIPMGLWLLIWGAKEVRPGAPALTTREAGANA